MLDFMLSHGINIAKPAVLAWKRQDFAIITLRYHRNLFRNVIMDVITLRYQIYTNTSSGVSILILLQNLMVNLLNIFRFDIYYLLYRN